MPRAPVPFNSALATRQILHTTNPTISLPSISLPFRFSDAEAEAAEHRLTTRIVSHNSDRFILLRLNPLGQRKLPIVISLSRMLCFGRVCAFPCALNVCAALQGAYIPTRSMDRKRFDEVRKADHVCRETLLRFRRTTCCFYDPIALTSNKKRRATFPSSKQRNLPICVPL